ncbi:dsDNA nuclease domain-containing protein [Pararhizobium sp. IMCC21322]|uniref:dsDNA nuclease domain-containing protein n=1 Tax=Pararhizobium sp. IMCC21322 TaxID=3067903 RepID=UPI0027408272|nr:dsDNA nuclease domain-containing protein [Pararhizobium sp. IMCC21322]
MPVHGTGSRPIAIFDDQCAPQNVQFYQVKSKKSGNWTPAALTKRDKKKDKDTRSFLGKMYENAVAFGDSVESATFLSNAPTNFAPSSKNKFCLTECDEGKLAEITKKLEEEFSGESTIKSELLWVSRTDLSLDDADAHAKGKLDAFVVENLGEAEFSLSAVFKAISDECDRKSRATNVDLSDFDEVVSRRGITRLDANGWLQAVSSTVNCPKWEEISADIHLPAPKKIRLRREWNSYRVAVLNPNEAVRKIRRRISSFIKDNDFEGLSLNDLLSLVFTAVAVEARAELMTASDERIEAMILYEAYSID